MANCGFEQEELAHIAQTREVKARNGKRNVDPLVRDGKLQVENGWNEGDVGQEAQALAEEVHAADGDQKDTIVLLSVRGRVGLLVGRTRPLGAVVATTDHERRLLAILFYVYGAHGIGLRHGKHIRVHLI